MKEIEKVPDDKLGNIYKVIHLLTGEISTTKKKAGKKGSLRGIWKGSHIDDSLFSAAEKSLFPYESNE